MSEKNCSSCKYQHHKSDEMPCNICFRSYIDKYEPLTNYDKIVNMDVREMANFLINLSDKGALRNWLGTFMKDETLVDCYKKWLLQEVSNDE